MATAKASKTKWQRPPEPPFIRDFVNLSIAGPHTHADVIQKIAAQFGWRVESLPEPLTLHTSICGRTVFGSARAYLNEIVMNYENLFWTLSDRVLRFDVRDARIDLSPFDELAGRLMRDAPRGAKGRISRDEYRRIAADLKGFEPKDCLEGQDGKALAEWNQKHPREAFHTFSAIFFSNPDVAAHRRFRRAMLKRLSRAQEKWKKAHP
jgi:hypothetical protein